MSIEILGTGSYVPPNRVTNDDLAKIMDTSDEWIASRTGIRERRISSQEMTTAMAVESARRALKDSGKKAEEIDLIIVATLSADYATPSTACQVQAALEASNAVCFDLNGACSGFIFALNTAKAYIETQMADTALIVGAETLSKMADWSDRSTCVLFADGAGAVVVTGKEGKLYETVLGSDGKKGSALTCGERKLNNLLIRQGTELEPIVMDGGAVFRFAISKVPTAIQEVLEKGKTSKEEIRYFVLHQANLRIIHSVIKRLKLSEEKFPVNVSRYGNTSGASIPILLDEINREGKLHRGDKIVLAGFGGGLTWGAILLEW